VDVIKYELAQAGFDVERTFCPFAYKVICPWIYFQTQATDIFLLLKNICAYVVEKDDIIFLIFRG
jgi:hypothetical protein